MYGTIAKLHVKPGAEPLLNAWFDGMNNAVKDVGWIATTIYRSDEDPHVHWMTVVFESREAYVANAQRPSQDARYRRLRSCLESDPEWHDGEVISRSTNAD
jgi:heme-degrading monooxygenase HmoA